jgi:hypothetical protein
MRIVLLAVLALLAAPAPAIAAERQIPRGWLGVMVDGPALGPAVDLGEQSRDLASAGAESVRVAVFWDVSQPYRRASDVPSELRDRYELAGGVPTDFSDFDRVVLAMAAQRVRVLPVVVRTPAWARVDPAVPGSPPRDARRYAAFLTALVERYGPRGTFWREHAMRRMPIRAWQIWNEPDHRQYWSDPDWVHGYVRLLRAASRAVHEADPGARVVMAGLTNRSWEGLDAIYEAGGRRWFDEAAIHPFSMRVRNVVRIVRYARRVMRSHGDARKPLALTEVSWSSAKGKAVNVYGWEMTEAGQARRVKEGLEALARVRRELRISRVVWFTWLSPAEGSAWSFDYSGLRKLSDGRVVDKPALKAFRRVARRLIGR